MIKIKVFILSAVTLLFCLNVNAKLQGQEGNGGAGFVVDGKYQTFYSAGIYTSKIPERTRDIPGMKELLEDINLFPGLSTKTKSVWISSIFPSTNRKYYKVLESQVDDQALEALVGKYKKAVGEQVSNPIGIFAITDKKTKTTALLPGFYALTKFEQMAILFHEAYWLVFPEDSYVDVINAEITAQEYFETKDPLSGLEFLKVIKSYSDSLFYAVEHDLKNHSLGHLISNDKVGLIDFFGEAYIQCLAAIPSSIYLQSNYDHVGVKKRKSLNVSSVENCKNLVLEEQYLKSLNFPDSLLVYLLSGLSYELSVFMYRGGNYSYVNSIGFYSLEDLKEAYISLEKSSKNSLSLNALNSSSYRDNDGQESFELFKFWIED